MSTICWKTTEEKRAALLALAKRRQADRSSTRYSYLADFHNGYYECDHVSPWSISACNVNAQLMLIAQDWASSDVLSKEPNGDRRQFGQDRSARTNVNVREFLERCFLIQFSNTYATNLFPFIKEGRKNATIKSEDLKYCARTYAIPQIKIVSPRMAICLGKSTFTAVRHEAGQPPLDWKEARSPNVHTRIGSVEIYGLPHPGPQGTLNAGGKDVVMGMWKALANRLQELREQT